MIWLSVLAACYVALVAVLTLLQDRLVFPGAGRGDRGLPALPRLSIARLQRRDGSDFRIVVAEPSPPPRGVALLFVGNGEDLFSAAVAADVLRAYELLVIGVEHPGYGDSIGPPTVARVLAGADAAATFARERADALGVPLLAFGSSLGTFCAVHLAAAGRVDRAVLRAPPTSMLAAARARFWWLPVRAILRHRFDNLAAAGRVHCPVLLLHGDADRVVPLAQGRQLAAAFATPGELLQAPGAGHSDLPLDRDGPYGARIAAFLAGR